METFWLREETKKNEFRRAIVPADCKKLIDAGHKVIVEDWKDSIIPIEDYAQQGCEVVASGSWVDSDSKNIIVGLKALPDNISFFKHRHIFFAHVFKEQDGYREILNKFKTGDGKIIDLEYMVNENGRRVCAFGYWAGYVGAALGALFYFNKTDEVLSKLKSLKRFKIKSDLIDFVKSYSTINNHKALVIGCMGRSGSGATDCLNELGWPTTGWDQKDTVSPGPYRDILNYHLFINCVLALRPSPPFLTEELIESSNMNLNMISDVSCDPDSDCNMIPLYSKASTLDNPLINVTDIPVPLSLVAIDNLPSILPKESSEDFSDQLHKHLLDYSEENGPINKALAVYSSLV